MSGYSQQGGSGGGGGGGSGGSSGQGSGCQRCGNPFNSYLVTSPDGSVTYHACPPSVVRQYAQTQAVGAARAPGTYCRTCQWVYAAFASYNADHPSGQCSKGHPDYQGQRPHGTYYCPMCRNTYDNVNLFLQEHSGGSCRGRRA